MLAPAVMQHQMQTGVAVEMIAVSALSAVQSAAQDLVDVMRPDCPPSPCGGMYVVIAGAAEGKDTATAPYIKPFREVESEIEISSTKNRLADQVDLTAWKIRKSILLARLADAIAGEMGGAKEVKAEGVEVISKKIGADRTAAAPEEIDAHEAETDHEDFDLDDEIEAAKMAYSAHLAKRPDQSTNASIIHSDWTPVGLMRSAGEGSKSIFLFNTESADVLSSLLGRFNSFFNASFDSAPIPRARADGRTMFSNYRVSALFGIQPAPFFKRIDRWGATAASSGTLGRLLFSAPHSTLGTRQIQQQVQLDREPLARLQLRLRVLLQAGQQRREADRQRDVEGVSPNAARYFREIYNEFQVHAAPGMILNGMLGQAGRGAEHTARIACGLHKLEERQGPIDVDVLDRARLIVDWHISQYLGLLASDRPNAQLESDAQAVAQALLHAAQYRLEHVSRKELKMWCAAEMSANRFHSAVQLLIARHLIAPKKDGRGVYLAATPLLLWQPTQGQFLPRR